MKYFVPPIVVPAILVIVVIACAVLRPPIMAVSPIDPAIVTPSQ